MAGSASLTSCKEWLDKDPESIISEDEAFKNYHNFQGFIEEIYDCVPDKEKVKWEHLWQRVTRAHGRVGHEERGQGTSWPGNL